MQKLGKGKGRSFATVSRENVLALQNSGRRSCCWMHAGTLTDLRRFAFPELLPPGWETEDWSTDFPTKSSLPCESPTPFPLPAVLPIHALSALAVIWSKIKRDLEENRDPDYDSDDEEAWSYDLLRA